MLYTHQEMLNKCNEILLQYSKLLVIKYDSNEIVLNNGYIITERKERNKFLKRLKNKAYYAYYDDLYSLDEKHNMETMKKIIKNNGKLTGALSWKYNRKKLYNMVLNNLNKARESGNCWKKLKMNGPWNKGLTKNNSESLRKLADSRVGVKNPMFGHKFSDEEKKKMSDRMKGKILNNEFTPNIHNRLTHFSCIINGKKYRSSWEGYFALKNPTYEYEKLRIPYEIDGMKKIYIVDFISFEDKKVCEVKPSSLFNGKIMQCKEKALLLWCKENNFNYERISEQYFIDNYDENVVSLLDERNRKNFITMVKNENKKHKNN